MANIGHIVFANRKSAPGKGVYLSKVPRTTVIAGNHKTTHSKAIDFLVE